MEPEPAAETLARSLRSLPRPFWFLIAGTVVNRFGGFVLFFLVIYLADKGYSSAESGLGIAAYGVGSILSALVGGHMADRLGRRNTIAISMAGSASSMLALSQVGGLAPILALAAVAGTMAELYRPATGALIADLVPSRNRMTAYAAYHFAINVGTAAGPAVAGFVSERSFLALFVVDAGTSLALAMIALTALPEGVRTRRHEESAGELLRVLRADRAFRIFLVASLLSAFVYMQAMSAFPLQVVADGHSRSLYGALLSLNGLLIVLLELPVVPRLQRHTKTTVIAVGFALEGLGFGLVAASGWGLWLALTVVIWTAGEIVSSPASSAHVADLSPERLRGRYQGAWQLTWALATVIGPALGTLIFGWSHAAIWLVCGAFGLSAAVLVTRTRRSVA